MDRLVVIDGGRTIEQGTHEELLQTGGLYASADVRFAQGLGPLSVAIPDCGGSMGFARRSVHRAGALAVKIAQRPE